MDSRSATLSYADHVIFLFMGGFFLAVTMERWNLHRRIALFILWLAGDSPSRLILGFMTATAFLSMWISNTATAVMMVPIGMSVISQIKANENDGVIKDERQTKNENNFAKSLMLTIAYTASIGGFITIIGTPPNIIMVGILERVYDIKIGFAQWMMISVPISLAMLTCMYFLLTKALFPTGDLKLASSKEFVIDEMKKLGKMTKPEKMVLCIGAFMALSWIFRGLIIKIPAFSMVTDTTIAVLGSVLLFLSPSFSNSKGDGERLMDWKTAVKIPWSIVLLFGGGLALASGFESTGLATWVSTNMSALAGMHILVFVFLVVLVANTLTEFMSNTAIATLFVPVMAATAVAVGFNPIVAAVPIAITASFSFMMPHATPPNAVAFGSGYLRMTDMVGAGVSLNVIGQIICTIAIVYLLPLVWRLDLTSLPFLP
jgi:sodium-dependent dicarboxylate transporter 2/3/5